MSQWDITKEDLLSLNLLTKKQFNSMEKDMKELIDMGLVKETEIGYEATPKLLQMTKEEKA